MSLTINLRDYQTASIQGLRDGIRAGHKRQILCAPTGAGKSLCAAFLIQEALAKYSKTYFIVDRISLLDQSVNLFESYGLKLGVIQAGHWKFRPWEHLQVCSVATLARRGLHEDVKLIIVDECHIQNKQVTEFILSHPNVVVVGLSATPLTKGLGRVYTNVVNVTTTNKLTADGWLSPFKAFAGKAIDMSGAKVKSTGEWDDGEMETRGIQIIGDVVQEWTDKTNRFFDGPVKTIIFSATVAHGEELCRQFQANGVNAQQISYKDSNDDRRRMLIEEFRKPDSEIMALCSCEALSRGFDVPDIKAGIFCRPYRKSLSGWIQQVGRIMRPYPGKEFALALDHSNNIIRFYDDMVDIFENGVSELDNGKREENHKEPEERAYNNACEGCGYILSKADLVCPSCGKTRPKRMNEVQHVAGELHEIGLKKKAVPEWLVDKELVWRQICHEGLRRKNNDFVTAEKWAKAQYRNLFESWPRYAMRNITPEPPSYELSQKLRSLMIRYAKSKQRTA